MKSGRQSFPGLSSEKPKTQKKVSYITKKQLLEIFKEYKGQSAEFCLKKNKESVQLLQNDVFYVLTKYLSLEMLYIL